MLLDGQTTEIRRHRDLVAFKKPGSTPYSFHAKNIQVAEISNELWNSMPAGSFTSASAFEIPDGQSDEFSNAIRHWEDSSGTAKLESRSRNKFNLTLNVTQLCNLHCHYCAAGGDGTYGDPVRQISVEKTLPQVKLLMNRLTPGGHFSITFLGGEPLMYPKAIQLIGEYTRDLGASQNIQTAFQIITNGTLINNEVLDLLAPIKPTITFSLDGPPEINDSRRPQRNGKSSTHQAIQGLEKLVDRKNEFGPILMHAVFNKDHLDVVRTWNFFKKFNIDKMEFTYDVTEKDETANMNFVESLKKAAALAFAEGGEKELRRIHFFDVYFDQLDNQYKKENYCGTGKSLLSLDSRNQIYQCPLEVSFKDRMVGQDTTINWKNLKSLEAPLIELNNCQNCWARHLCGGGCLFNHESLTGDKHTKHITYCFRTRHLLSEVIMYYKNCRETE
jgi:uncharacterized protein